MFRDRKDGPGGTAQGAPGGVVIVIVSLWKWPGDLGLEGVKEDLVADRLSISDRTRQGKGKEIKLPIPRARMRSPRGRQE